MTETPYWAKTFRKSALVVFSDIFCLGQRLYQHFLKTNVSIHVKEILFPFFM